MGPGPRPPSPIPASPISQSTDGVSFGPFVPMGWQSASYTQQQDAATVPPLPPPLPPPPDPVSVSEASWSPSYSKNAPTNYAPRKPISLPPVAQQLAGRHGVQC